MTDSIAPRIFVAGHYAEGDGYPNGRITCRVLTEMLGLTVIDVGTPMTAGPLWKRANSGAVARFSMGLEMLWQNLGSAIRVLQRAARPRDIVYVRYPAVPFLLLMSLLPRRYRPTCYADAFISIWDTLYIDRQRATAGLLSSVVRWLESRALKTADKVLVDTQANASFMVQQFALASHRVRAIPLGVDEARWASAASLPAANNEPFTVLFVGTFVPLHGIERITAAIEQFSADDAIRFAFIGDGQEAPTLERLILARPDLDISWQRGWQSAESIAAAVASADVCLGVFGGEGKASRVLPYKLYLYFCVGRAVISQGGLSTPGAVELPPVAYLSEHTAGALSAMIRKLKDDAGLRGELASGAKSYFLSHLSNRALASAWRELLPPHFTGVGAPAQPD